MDDIDICMKIVFLNLLKHCFGKVNKVFIGVRYFIV